MDIHIEIGKEKVNSKNTIKLLVFFNVDFKVLDDGKSNQCKNSRNELKNEL